MAIVNGVRIWKMLETLMLISLPWLIVIYHYIRLSITGEFEYLWNSREIYEEDIQ